jgi:FYVE/RhoGEF/PH domain-containing protein 5/6
MSNDDSEQKKDNAKKPQNTISSLKTKIQSLSTGKPAKSKSSLSTENDSQINPTSLKEHSMQDNTVSTQNNDVAPSHGIQVSSTTDVPKNYEEHRQRKGERPPSPPQQFEEVNTSTDFNKKLKAGNEINIESQQEATRHEESDPSLESSTKRSKSKPVPPPKPKKRRPTAMTTSPHAPTSTENNSGDVHEVATATENNENYLSSTSSQPSQISPLKDENSSMNFEKGDNTTTTVSVVTSTDKKEAPVNSNSPFSIHEQHTVVALSTSATSTKEPASTPQREGEAKEYNEQLQTQTVDIYATTKERALNSSLKLIQSMTLDYKTENEMEEKNSSQVKSTTHPRQVNDRNSTTNNQIASQNQKTENSQIPLISGTMAKDNVTSSSSSGRLDCLKLPKAATPLDSVGTESMSGLERTSNPLISSTSVASNTPESWQSDLSASASTTPSSSSSTPILKQTATETTQQCVRLSNSSYSGDTPPPIPSRATKPNRLSNQNLTNQSTNKLTQTTQSVPSKLRARPLPPIPTTPSPTATSSSSTSAATTESSVTASTTVTTTGDTTTHSSVNSPPPVPSKTTKPRLSSVSSESLMSTSSETTTTSSISLQTSVSHSSNNQETSRQRPQLFSPFSFAGRRVKRGLREMQPGGSGTFVLRPPINREETTKYPEGTVKAQTKASPPTQRVAESPPKLVTSSSEKSNKITTFDPFQQSTTAFPTPADKPRRFTISGPAPDPPSSSFGSSQNSKNRKHDEMTRQRCLKIAELIETEKTYLKNLQNAMEWYYQPMKAGESPIPWSKGKVLFGDLEGVIALTQEFLDYMQKHIPSKITASAAVAPIFINFAPRFKLHVEYAIQHQISIKTMSELERKKAFTSWLTEIYEKHGKGQDLLSLLIQPVQRIPRYKLFLEDILKLTPENHPDYKELPKALQSIEEVANAVNSCLRKHENLTKLQEVIRNYGYPKELEDMFEQEREFVKEGMLMKLCRKEPKPRHFVLCSDILIYGKKGTLHPYELNRILELSKITIKDIPDTIMYENAFEVRSTGKSFIIYAKSYQEKTAWLYAFSHVLKQSVEVPSAPVWVPDQESKYCLLCAREFTPVFRRHHCRNCGLLVCAKCSSKRAIVVTVDAQKPKRVCSKCYTELTVKSKTEGGGNITVSSNETSSEIDDEHDSSSEEEGDTSDGKKKKSNVLTTTFKKIIQSPLVSGTPSKQRRFTTATAASHEEVLKQLSQRSLSVKSTDQQSQTNTENNESSSKTKSSTSESQNSTTVNTSTT